MPRRPKKPDQEWRTGSALVSRPDHVHALGMISIELGHLEGMLGCLLGALLHISPDIGRLIYLAPRAALGRIAIIERILDVTLKDGSETRAAIEKNLQKAKAILGKRHDFIHGRWGLSDLSEQAEVFWHSVPFEPEKPARPVPLSELTGLIDSIRSTADDIAAITEELYEGWPPYSSQARRPKRQPAATTGSARPRPSGPPKPPRLPRSSRA
jgi:hypothetical protein